MELNFFIILAVLLVLAGIIAWRISDWGLIDKYNQRFYENGYHIYYDRRIIKQKENKNLNILDK